MLYCGQQSNGLFLYTMLYEDVPVGPVQFRVIVGGEPHLENEFYTQGAMNKSSLILDLEADS